LSRLHPGSENSGMGDYIQKFAASFGVHGMRRTTRVPNTRRALAVAEFARDQGKLDTFRSLTMDAHWKEGKDIEDTAVLRGLAAASGLDPDRAIQAADDPAYAKRLVDVRREYRRLGVGGIPTFDFGTEQIEGCQSYDVIADAASRAGAVRRS